jgi:hypothetical protein
MKWKTIWPVTASPVAGQTAMATLLQQMNTPRLAGPKLVREEVGNATRELALLRKSLAKLSDAEIERRARAMFPENMAVPTDTDSMGQMLFGLAAIERLQPRPDVLPEYEHAFDRYRQRDWPAVRTSLKTLIAGVRR